MNNGRGKTVESYFANTNGRVPQTWNKKSEVMLFEKNNVKAKAAG
jgi:hypothetical protein